MKIIGKLICRFKGHLRGKLIKRVQIDKHATRPAFEYVTAHYVCPRCLSQWTRKVKVKA